MRYVRAVSSSSSTAGACVGGAFLVSPVFSTSSTLATSSAS